MRDDVGVYVAVFAESRESNVVRCKVVMWVRMDPASTCGMTWQCTWQHLWMNVAV